MDKPEPNFTVADFLVDCLVGTERKIDGYTTLDLERITGKARRTVRHKLRIGIDTGVWKHAGERLGKTIDGRYKEEPVYQLTEKGESMRRLLEEGEMP